MAEQFEGRVFVTSSAKALAVRNLLEYWTLKTELLKKKQDPTVFASKEVQQKTHDYLTKNSKLKENPFWSALGTQGQELATKCFSVQDVPKPKKEILCKNRLKAAVFVCLSGFATVRNLKTQAETRYGPGEVFGATDTFNKVVQNKEDIDTYDREEQNAADMIIEFSEGTFMRMELKDLYSTVLKPDEADVEQQAEIKEMETAVAISGIPWQQMTDDDKFYVRVYKRTKALVNKRFFSFLDSYRMVPKNSHMPCFKYYNESLRGRETYLDDQDQTWVFIVIDGSMKVELCSTRKKGEEGTLSYVRKSDADNTMHIKTKTMPLMSLSSGAIMCVQPECFYLADPPEPAEGIPIPHIHTSESEGALDAKKAVSKFRSGFPHNKLPRSGAVGGTNAGAGAAPTHARERRGSDATVETFSTVRTASTFHTASMSIDSRVHTKSDHFVPSSTPPTTIGAMYHIKMVFEQPTSYLAVPYATFERILDDNKRVLPKIAKEIKWYLNSPNELMKERITRLLPWVLGNLDFNQKQKSLKIINTLDFLPADPGPKKADDLAHTIGSFPSMALPNLRVAIDDSLMDFQPSTPQLPARSPKGFGGENPAPLQSFKTTPKSNSARDQTLSAMLSSLRHTRASSKVPAGVTTTSASMFLTQDGTDRDFSLLEEPAGSDSDVSISAFKRQPPSSKNVGNFNDSTRSMKEDWPADIDGESVQISQVSGVEFSASPLSTKKVVSVSIGDVQGASLATSQPSEVRDEVDLESLESSAK